MSEGALTTLVRSAPRFFVRQIKEWGEILTGFEAKNRYEIQVEGRGVVARAAEEGSGIGAALLRSLLRAMRKATIHVYGPDGTEIARGHKPFRFFFHRMEVFEGERRLGAIQRKFSILNRVFAVEDQSGREVLILKSPFLRIWTFKLLFGEKEVGRIAKKWGGVMREMFTDADSFGVEFTEESLSPDVRALLLVGTFLVDFTCFEK